MEISYEAFFEQSPVPSVVLSSDEELRVLNANRAFTVLSGMDLGQLQHKRLGEIFLSSVPGEASVRKIESSLLEARNSLKPSQIRGHHFHISGSDGEPLVCQWDTLCVPLLNAEKQAVAMILQVEEIVACVNDDTNGAQAKQEIESLRQQKEEASETAHLLQAVVDTAQAGMFLFEPVYDEARTLTDFRFRMANKMISSYVGQQPDALIGELGSRWFPGYKINGLFDKYSDTFLNGNTNRFDFHYDNDGIDVWLDIMSTPVNGDVLVTFTDFTSLKTLQNKLEDHVEELRSSNASLEQFAYIASHDLQEPLRKIKAFGDMLQSRYQEAVGKEGTDLISRMQSAASRMSHLIEDLLTYSRVSVKPGKLEVIDTNKVLDGILFDLERMIQQNKAELQVDKLAPVAGQETQIGQVFLNLITNALKFHKPDQPPQIRIESIITTGRESGMNVNQEDAGKQYQLIRVTDKGIGFDMQYRDKIFQIFQRLHGRTEYPGTGVGLSIVKKVIENHNGYIDAKAEPDAGAAFSILLPVVRE
jgi:signal transduction histidine kinase